VGDGSDKPREADPEGDPDAPVPPGEQVPARYETPREQQLRLREEREHRRRRRITEAGVALAALFVSLSVFMINGLLYLRGSQVAVLPPESVTLYRDTGPNGSALWVAMQAQMINAAAADYGDVAVSADVAFGPRRQERGRFAYAALVEPTMTNDVEKAVENCPQGARCIANTGFNVIERPRKLLDVPGGTSRSEYLAFLIEGHQCKGEPAYCHAFGGFEDAVEHLRSLQQPVIRLNLEFYFDGKRSVACRLSPDPKVRAAVFDYLVEKGWAAVECVRT